MRNRNIIFIVLATVLVMLQGCSNFLTVDIPDTLVKEDYWKSEDHAKAALSGVYKYLGSNLERFIIWGAIRSDLYSDNGFSGGEIQMARQDITTTNGLANWNAVYSGINQTNSFIKNAHLVTAVDASFTTEKLNTMLGQAYGIRALYYFYLVRAFKDVPVIMEPYESDLQSPYYAATPENDVLDIIENDLRIALELAPDTYNRIEDRYGRITKNAVRAIWADVKLWRGDFEGVITLCKTIDKDYRGKMENQDTWFTMFSAGNSRESIFEYQYVDEGPASPVGSLFNGRLGANPKAYIQNLKKAYPPLGMFESSDTVRVYRMYTSVSTSSNSSVYKSFKHVGLSYDRVSGRVLRDATGLAKVNFIFYRYREVMLMKAEALAHLKRYDEALDEINEIRRSLDLETVTVGEYGTEDVFMDKLIAERVAELGFEGKEWFTLVRFARLTGTKNLLIDRVAENSDTGIKEQILRARLVEEDSWFMPYFDTEVENNRFLEQKEFYKGKR